MTTQPEKIVYTAVATSSEGGRAGRAVSDDGKVDVMLTAPSQMGGPGTGSNPEQLFAAGYSACFNSSLGHAAKEIGVAADGSQVRAHAGMGPQGETFALTVDLEVYVPELDLATAQRVADGAHEVCPYSKATRGNVPVTVTAVSALN